MPYITRDGTIAETQPWGLKKITQLFWGTVDLIVAYFQTMLHMDSGNSRSVGWSGGGRGVGHGGGGYGGGPRVPRHSPPTSRTGSNIHGMSDLPPPPPSTCPGGGCGRM